MKIEYNGKVIHLSRRKDENVIHVPIGMDGTELRKFMDAHEKDIKKIFKKKSHGKNERHLHRSKRTRRRS